ncbi:MAG: fatty acid desaturase [Gammaproteobacteria bacterium]|nr:fatty acid desaturase [Gammaproteobacteria bacterium]
MTINYAAIDKQALAQDIDAIRAQIGPPTVSDFQHLRKMEFWGRLSAIFGYATAWIFPFNPISALLISTANVGRWANVSHPVLHGAYEKVPGVPQRYTRKGFAKGWRRIIDWLDWIYPEAWEVEHNNMHHYHLGERDDPDHMEYNMEWLRRSKLPYWLRYLIVSLFAGIWKAAYYAPNTLKILGNVERRRRGEAEHDTFIRADAWNPFAKDGFTLWSKFYLPYFLFRFVLIPLLFLPLGMVAVFNVFTTSLLAEILTNLHSFLVIIPNHSASDIYRFEEPSDSKGEFYLRQIIGSVNYQTGSNLIDFFHGWLNYQIEHHLFPSLPLSQYQKMQPLVKEICSKHNLPYRQHSVFRRLKMTLDLMVGKSDLLVISRA